MFSVFPKYFHIHPLSPLQPSCEDVIVSSVYAHKVAEKEGNFFKVMWQINGRIRSPPFLWAESFLVDHTTSLRKGTESLGKEEALQG